ncbi:MAG: copper amine oxidase N-terminal domain-containing protein, partial [Clostridiales bacterium]|nr:copper amine oxidase N-terminal domain-containing protein [Clostridiales bacterium]
KFTLGVSAICEYSDYDSIQSIDFPTLTDENSADLLMLSIPDNYNGGINVTVNGSPVVFDVPPQLVNDRIMLPMRAVFEALGASVDYNDGVITAVSGGKTIIHTIGESTVYVNNEAIETDVPSFVTNGRTLVPLSFISEALGADVQWVEETQTVVITLN